MLRRSIETTRVIGKVAHSTTTSGFPVTIHVQNAHATHRDPRSLFTFNSEGCISEAMASDRFGRENQAHFKDLVLIEGLVEHIDARFKMNELGQLYTRDDYPNNFQCAYDEALLSLDGKAVIERSMHCVRGSGPLRFAFYLHFYHANRPLRWSYGEVQCPTVEPAPRRLKSLVPYRATNS